MSNTIPAAVIEQQMLWHVEHGQSMDFAGTEVRANGGYFDVLVDGVKIAHGYRWYDGLVIEDAEYWADAAAGNETATSRLRALVAATREEKPCA